MSEEGQDLEIGRILRVTLPVRQHIQLHKMRLLVGKNMSGVVSEALDMYFRAFNDKGSGDVIMPDAPESDRSQRPA